jgi:hypothetical protein
MTSRISEESRRALRTWSVRFVVVCSKANPMYTSSTLVSTNSGGDALHRGTDQRSGERGIRNHTMYFSDRLAQQIAWDQKIRGLK